MLGKGDYDLVERVKPRVLAAAVTAAGFRAFPPISAFTDDNDDDDCGRTTAYLAAYADNELDVDQRSKVEDHLNNCVRCAADLDTLQHIDGFIQRDWRDSAPLPSSIGHAESVAAIIAALPPESPIPVSFARKRVHVRARWSRIAAGIAGIVSLIGLVWYGGSSARVRAPQSGNSHSRANDIAIAAASRPAHPTYLPYTGPSVTEPPSAPRPASPSLTR